MARTDKDQPFYVLSDRGEEREFWFKGDRTSSNFRKGRKAIKREGNKRARRRAFNDRYAGRCPFYDTKTVRTEVYFL